MPNSKEYKLAAADPGPQDGTTPAWYRELPLWARVATQISFAALIAVLFGLDSRERSSQLREFQNNVWLQAKEDRQWYREDSKQQRDGNDRRAAIMVEQLQALTRAVELQSRQTERMADFWERRSKENYDSSQPPKANKKDGD